LSETTLKPQSCSLAWSEGQKWTAILHKTSGARKKEKDDGEQWWLTLHKAVGVGSERGS